MFKNSKDKEIATHKAEILYKEKWVEFYILNKNDDFINLNTAVIDSLPKTLYYNDHQPMNWDWNDKVIMKL